MGVPRSALPGSGSTRDVILSIARGELITDVQSGYSRTHARRSSYLGPDTLPEAS